MARLYRPQVADSQIGGSLDAVAVEQSSRLMTA